MDISPLIALGRGFISTVEPQFNGVVGDWPNLFVKSRVRYIENLDITSLKCYYDKIRLFLILAILKHKQVVCT